MTSVVFRNFVRGSCLYSDLGKCKCPRNKICPDAKVKQNCAGMHKRMLKKKIATKVLQPLSITTPLILWQQAFYLLTARRFITCNADIYRGGGVNRSTRVSEIKVYRAKAPWYFQRL